MILGNINRELEIEIYQGKKLVIVFVVIENFWDVVENLFESYFIGKFKGNGVFIQYIISFCLLLGIGWQRMQS